MNSVQAYTKFASVTPEQLTMCVKTENKAATAATTTTTSIVLEK